MSSNEKLYLELTAIDAINNAKAGVGKPLKLSTWFVILKIANLIADNRIIINERKGNHSNSVDKSIRLNIKKVGASPKLITSDNESNCFPNSDCAFKILAINPSKKSNIEAIKINKPAKYKKSGKRKEI